MTSAICNIVKDYIPNDYRGGISVGAAGGVLVACSILKYFDSLSDNSSKKADDFILGKEVVLITKGALVTFCAATGGALGFISYIKTS